MLTVAYDGTNYHGYQIQKNGITIEEVLTGALCDLTGENIVITGGSRTDAGVHALSNMVVFDTEARMPGEKYSYALNQRLPLDIRILKSEEVSLDFHPRHCNSKKTYEYRILNAEFLNPVKRLYYHHVYVPLSIEKMQEASKFLVGEHDFTSFCSAGAQVESKVRTIYDISISKKDDDITISVTGNGFLYNMVRIIAGTLIEVGRGSITPEEITSIIEAKDREAAGPTAPACGLCLMKYEFEE